MFLQGLVCAPMLSYTHKIIPLERVTKKEKTEGIYQPINFFQRYSEVTLVNNLVYIYPNWYTVSILQILITHFTIYSQNHMVLASYCLLRGMNFGGKVFAKIKAPSFFSWIEKFMVVSTIGSPTDFPIYLIIYIMGNNYVNCEIKQQ